MPTTTSNDLLTEYSRLDKEANGMLAKVPRMIPVRTFVVECWGSDNGAGIPVELLDNVFDKGVTDPEGKGGTGLGLAIVKTFIEDHGGIVTAESKPEAGSTFRFSLPTKANVSGGKR